MSISEIMQSARFIVGNNGRPSAVILNMEIWENLLLMLEDAGDNELVRQRMKNWQTKEGWTSWDEFEAEWCETGYLLSSSKNAEILQKSLEEPVDECRDLEDILIELES